MAKDVVAQNFELFEWPGSPTTYRTYAPTAYPLLVLQDRTPPAITVGDLNTCLLQGIRFCRTNIGRGRLCNGPFVSGGGYYGTDDAGVDGWTRIGNCTPWFTGASTQLDNPIGCAINPDDPDEEDAWCGVRGTAQGFYQSTDAGLNMVRNGALDAAFTTAGYDNSHDVYGCAHDPLNFARKWVTFHSGVGGASGGNATVAHTEDNGATWTLWTPGTTWGNGHSVHYIAPGKILIGTQTDGLWLCNEDGTTRTKVSDGNIAHGGNELVKVDGVWYAGGDPTCQVSYDDCETWEDRWVDSWSVVSDDLYLYFGRTFTTAPMYRVDVADDTTYEAVPLLTSPIPQYDTGAFSQDWLTSDRRVLFTANMRNGVFAVRLREEP